MLAPRRGFLRPESPTPSGADTSIESDMTDEDMFFEGGELPADSSFVFSVTEGTPSPRRMPSNEALPKKFKSRDSGVMLSDDDEFVPMAAERYAGGLLTVPQASASVSTLGSNDDESGLITPCFGPSASSSWPVPDIADPTGNDDGGQGGVDAFIMRTLAAVAKKPADTAVVVGEGKKPPGTPVKKVKTSNLSTGGTRPWQTAVAQKVGLNFDLLKSGKPRKSLPAVFANVKDKAQLLKDDSDSDSEDEFSPSTRKAGKYEGLGLGRPTLEPGAPFAQRTKFLMRRSSSGALSTGSEASLGTPTRQGRGKPHQFLSQLISADMVTDVSKRQPVQSRTPTKQPQKPSPAGSASSNDSGATTALNSPSIAAAAHHRLPIYEARRTPAPASRLSVGTNDDELGRFERDFVELDELGNGEFGKVMKVRLKGTDKVYAVKRSKQFEGVRQR